MQGQRERAVPLVNLPTLPNSLPVQTRNLKVKTHDREGTRMGPLETEGSGETGKPWNQKNPAGRVETQEAKQKLKTNPQS